MLTIAARTLAEAVLCVLLAAPRFHAEPTPEPDAARLQRLTAAALVITGAAAARPAGWEPFDVAAPLLALGDAESSWAAYVAQGRCADGPVGARCDPGPHGARARTYWQLHVGTCPAAWAEPPGSFAELHAAAGCASRLYVGAYYRCARARPENREAGAMSGYHGGASGCYWKPADRHARKLRAVRRNLRAALEQSDPLPEYLSATLRPSMLTPCQMRAGWEATSVLSPSRAPGAAPTPGVSCSPSGPTANAGPM